MASVTRVIAPRVDDGLPRIYVLHSCGRTSSTRGRAERGRTARSFTDKTRMSLDTGALFSYIARMYGKRDSKNFVLWNPSETNKYFVTQGKEAPGQRFPLRWSLQLATERR